VAVQAVVTMMDLLVAVAALRADTLKVVLL